MGEASRRGTFEERKKRAIEKLRLEMIANPPKNHKQRELSPMNAMILYSLANMETNILSSIVPTNRDIDKYRKDKRKRNNRK